MSDNSMVKIMQIDSSSAEGGGQKIVYGIVQSLKNKHNLMVACPSGEYFDRYKKTGIVTVEVKNIFDSMFRMRKLIKDQAVQILHAHGTRAAVWARCACVGLKNRPKIIYTLQGFHLVNRKIFVKRVLLMIERFLNRWTDVLVCVSKSNRSEVVKEKTINEDKIRLIKNGINFEDFKVDENDELIIKEKLGIKREFILTSVSRLCRPKDVSTILKALKLTISENNNFRLLVVGDGPLKDRLKKEAIELKLNKYVDFLGFRKDLSVIMHISDAIVLSTKWEGLPLVVMEAGICKKPVIASNIAPIREIVTPGVNGLLFTPGSSEDLKEKICKLSSSRRLCEDMGEEAFRIILDNFDQKKMIEKYSDLYDTVSK